MKRNSFLTEYRKQNNLTQTELANEMGINAAVLSRVERNIGNESVRRVLNWCRNNNLSPDKIYPTEPAA